MASHSTIVQPPTITLVRPEIAPNTGNIGRLCVGFGATLNLVGQLGFEINDKNLRRAGLDYWPKLRWQHLENEQQYRDNIDTSTTVLFTTKASESLSTFDFTSTTQIVFGAESRGLDDSWHNRQCKRVYIPSTTGVRSFNLANSVAIALAEWSRQNNWYTQIDGAEPRI